MSNPYTYKKLLSLNNKKVEFDYEGTNGVAHIEGILEDIDTFGPECIDAINVRTGKHFTVVYDTNYVSNLKEMKDEPSSDRRPS